MGPDDILNQIDHALEDNELRMPDAMRWTPEPVGPPVDDEIMAAHATRVQLYVADQYDPVRVWEQLTAPVDWTYTADTTSTISNFTMTVELSDVDPSLYQLLFGEVPSVNLGEDNEP